MLRFWRKPYIEKKEMIVNLVTNTSFRAIVWKVDGQFLVLRNAQLLNNDKSKSLDGEVVVRLADVEFLQVL